MILIIDNYDSFTFNLVQLVAMAEIPYRVVRNDEMSVEELLALKPEGLLLSPGPGRPENAGVCVPLLRRQPQIPLLGVCLGHQALGVAFGARVERAPEPRHGKVSQVRHSGDGLFVGLPNPFEATRYHSLVVSETTLPEVLEAVAWSEDDGLIMGLRHRLLPYWGVQFHPESVLTASGPHLVQNFLELCQRGAGSP
jgi:anthranilate synthase/aminodeoxychorismate synthase-like glutamine amidotransferase